MDTDAPDEASGEQASAPTSEPPAAAGEPPTTTTSACAHCGAPARGAGTHALVPCRDCGRSVHAHCPAPSRCPVRAQAGVLEFHAAPSSPRADVLLALALASAASGGGVGLAIGLGELLTRALGLSRALAYTMGTGAGVLPTLVALTVLFHRYLQHRSVHVDARGVLLGVTPRWRGKRLPFADLRGFSETAHGVMLHVRGRPWTRWLGPLLRCDGLLRHELIERLEAEGVYRAE